MSDRNTLTDSAKKTVSPGKFWGIGLLWVIVWVTLDQWTKYLAERFLKGTSGIPVLPGCFELQYLENRGAAFGMMQGKMLFFFLITLVILLLLLYLLIKMPRKRHYLFLNRICCLMIAGALGNLIDRTLRGYVVDFFYFSLIDFPIFNVADICAV
ncbi:MAG: signal peptidase II, partial [Eubacteriales bacterium]|nr:signal peptidase II [Eubacteriales bacterium]